MICSESVHKLGNSINKSQGNWVTCRVEAKRSEGLDWLVRFKVGGHWPPCSFILKKMLVLWTSSSRWDLLNDF